MLKKYRFLFISLLLIVIISIAGFYILINLKKQSSYKTVLNNSINQNSQPNESQEPFEFFVLSDQRNFTGSEEYDTSDYFRGALEKIDNQGKGDFLFILGDLDPVLGTNWSIDKYLGENYTWYPVVGNHELPGQGTEDYKGENIQFLRAFEIKDRNKGPLPCSETTYSFDHQNVHFAILNEYCNDESDKDSSGDISDLLYNWLVNDLYKAGNKIKLVFGHEPAYPQPDKLSGRLRHDDDSLNEYPANRDRFWNLLKEENVLAYFCGHTHNYSTYQYDGIWQIDTGHARGVGDTESKSTFVKVKVENNILEYETFRTLEKTSEYMLTESEKLN